MADRVSRDYEAAWQALVDAAYERLITRVIAEMERDRLMDDILEHPYPGHRFGEVACGNTHEWLDYYGGSCDTCGAAV